MKKLVSILLLALVFALAFTSCSNYDEQMEEIYQQQEQINILVELIAKLNEAIVNLERDLAHTQDVIDANKEIIDALEKDSINKDEWDEATLVLANKILEIHYITKDYVNAQNENGEFILDMNKYWDWNMRADELQAKAVSDLSRATSVAKMDEIIAQYERDLRSIPTRVEELYALIESIEADGVTVDDSRAVEKIIAYDMFNYIDVLDFPGETYEEQVASKEKLLNIFEKLFEAYKEALKAYFIEMVYELPDVDYVKISDRRAVIEAREFLYYLYSLNIEMSKGTAKKAVQKLDELEERIDMLEYLKAVADDLNETIRTAFDGKKFLLDTATLEIIEALEEAINELFYGSLVYLPGDPNYDAEDPARNPDGWEDLYDIALMPDDADFNEYVYNFVDHSTLEMYRVKYEGLRAELEVAVEAFYNAVKAYDNVTSLQSYYDVEEDATNAYSAILTIVGLDQINVVDKLLGNTTEDDKIEMIINGVEVEVFPFAGHKTVYQAILKEVATIKAAVKALADFNTKDLRDVVCTVANHVTDPSVMLGVGQKYCDCDRDAEDATFGAINKNKYEAAIASGKFDASVRALKTLMTTYEFTAEEILGAHYDNYLEVAAKALKDEAYAAIEASATIDAADKAGCKIMVDCALANGVVFEVEFVEDTNDNDIQDPFEYDWAGKTKVLFDMLKAACGH